ncbi:MAG: TonB family protein [Bacteroidia bacterium]|nr:TonB family protein [Bacteroidia bacterium]
MRTHIFLLCGLFFLPADLISQNSKPEPIDGWIALRKKAEQNPIVDSMLNEKGLVVAFYTAEISKKGVLKSLTLNDEGPLNGPSTKVLTAILQGITWKPKIVKGKPKATIYEFSFSISRYSKSSIIADSTYKAQRQLYDSLAKLCTDTLLDGSLTDSASQKIQTQYGLDINSEMPRYPGGDAGFIRFIENNFKYPVRCLEAGISANVLVRFSINPYGKPSKIQMIKNSKLCPEFGIEAMRVIKETEFWIPAIWQGYYISTYRKIPINLQTN